MIMETNSLMLSATDFLNSNYFRAEDLDPSVLIETTIVSVRTRDFDDGSHKLIVYTDHQGQGVVLNQTRLKTMIAAFGSNFDNWSGKKIVIRRGSTLYSGKQTPAIVVEPVVPTRIAAEQRQGRIAIESGKSAAIEPLSEINPPSVNLIDDDIPF
jgi:hypothetical protein